MKFVIAGLMALAALGGVWIYNHVEGGCTSKASEWAKPCRVAAK